MDCPKYANAFTVTYNPPLGEVVINFLHDYPIIDGLDQRDSATGQIQTSAGRENVCGVVLSKNIARQLLDVVSKSLSENKNDE